MQDGESAQVQVCDRFHGIFYAQNSSHNRFLITRLVSTTHRSGNVQHVCCTRWRFDRKPLPTPFLFDQLLRLTAQTSSHSDELSQFGSNAHTGV